MKKITIGIADDHQLFLKSLSLMVSSFPGFSIVIESLNGVNMLEKMKSLPEPPDILLVDVNMPLMDGVTTTREVTALYPGVKIAALSMKDDDATIINMLKAGCCAYFLKDIHPAELENALLQIYEKGYYNGDASNVNFRRLLIKTSERNTITEREREFLQLASTDLTYKEIAHQMHLSERTVDGYREVLFQKLNVQSRVGMVLEAIRRQVISL